MTIADVAESEKVTVRQAQRYCREGYKGHVLKATKVGRGFVIEESDYRAWRIECGFDFLPAPERSTAAVPAIADPAAPSGSTRDDDRPNFAELQRRYFSPDRIGGPVTNTYAVGSGTMCSPQTCREYMAACAERMKSQLRGYSDEA